MNDAIARHRLRTRLDAAVAAANAEGSPTPTPILVVDLDAFDANAADLARRANGVPIRLASKSLRVPHLIERALQHDGFSGVLAFTLAEALWLHERGISDDIVIAYPTVDRAALARLVGSPSAAAAITLMIDDPAHLEVVDSVRHSRAVAVRIAIDIDAGLRLGGEQVTQHIGPKRSPLSTPEEVAGLARAVEQRNGFRLVGAMTYEGQVAGVPDQVPGQRAKSLAIRQIKRASINQLVLRRSAIAAALAQVAPLEFWNAGGSGSLESSSADPMVTEVAAGSGLLVPGLFDHYASFDPHPAAYFGLPVTRRPSPDTATVHGGGLIASGPAGGDRLPTPWAPPGLKLTTLEGAGEVQTPVTGHAAQGLHIGDLVWFRHAKSGELFEHGNYVHLLTGDRFLGRVATYRGEGLAT